MRWGDDVFGYDVTAPMREGASAADLYFDARLALLDLPEVRLRTDDEFDGVLGTIRVLAHVPVTDGVVPYECVVEMAVSAGARDQWGRVGRGRCQALASACRQVLYGHFDAVPKARPMALAR